MMIAIAALLAAAAAPAHPVYLQCIFSNKTPIDIIADEANSAVTVSLSSTGYTEKLPAAFTAAELRFQNSSLSYVISRTDLTARRTIKLISSTDTGTCKVQVAPVRAF